MDTPALMFGIGATRGGTSWLYQYLRTHPQCHLRPVKEAHWFNTLEQDRFAWRAASLDRAQARFATRAQKGKTPAARAEAEAARAAAADLAGLLAQSEPSDAAYLEWLDEGRAPQARLVGDITPAYATLRVPTLQRMAGLRPVVRFVYLLRDPVERLWSNVRQSVARDPDAQGGAATSGLEARAQAHLGDWLNGGRPGLQSRSDYRTTLERLDRAVAPENLLVLFHEELFTDAALARLTGFLGLDPHPAPLEKRVHASRPLPLEPRQVTLIRDRLAPQYDYIRDRFGAAVPPQWGANTAEVSP